MFLFLDIQIELDIDLDDKVCWLSGYSIVQQKVLQESRFKITRIKEKVEEQSGVPPPQQRLIFSGRQMYEIGSLSLDLIVDTSSVGLMTRPRGNSILHRDQCCIWSLPSVVGGNSGVGTQLYA